VEQLLIQQAGPGEYPEMLGLTGLMRTGIQQLDLLPMTQETVSNLKMVEKGVGTIQVVRTQ